MEHTQFNSFDITLAGVLISSGIFAFRRGLVREVMALGTWVLASLFAFSFYPLAKPLLEQQIKNQMLADASTAIGLFCVAIIILVPLGDYLSGLVKTPTLSSIDRSLGFVFGVVRGFIIMCLLYLGMTFAWPEDQDSQPPFLANAKTKSALAYGVKVLKSVVPDTIEEDTKETLDDSREAAAKAVEDAKHLDEISTPVPTYSKTKEKASSYGDDARDKMNNLIDRN